MSEWREYLLEDVIDRFIDYRGKTPKKTDSGIPLVTAKVVKSGKILPPNEFIAADDYDAWMTRGLPKVDDVVLTTEAPLGEVALITDTNVALAQRIITMRTKEDLAFGPFLKFYFQNGAGQHELQSRASGTTVFGIKASVLRKVPVELPSVHEQKAIAAILSSLDDKIDLLHRQNKTLEAMAETLFRQWFVENATDYKEELLGGLIRLQRGISYSGKTLGELGEGLPMHSLNSINVEGDYKYEGIKSFIGDAKPSQILKPGDLLIINTDMTPDNRIIGWPIFVPDKFESSVCTHHLYGVSLIDNRITKLYLYFLLRSREYRNELANAANGTTVSMLSKEAVENLRIKIPPIEKIGEFEVHARSSLDKRLSNQLQIEVLEKLRDTLLPKLMSGEIRVAY